MELIWHGHSCFTVRAGGCTVVLDPYSDGSVPGYAPLRLTANRVLCSHGHHDHAGTECVTLTPGGADPFTVMVLDCWHDDQAGALRGPNRIHILQADGMRVAHFGDLGETLSPQQLAAIGHLDAAMIPVGGYYTIDAAQAADLARALDADCIIPMHYRLGAQGYAEIAPLSDFLALLPHRILPGPEIRLPQQGIVVPTL